MSDVSHATEIANQNNEYLSSMINDFEINNKKIVKMMNETVEIREQHETDERLEIMNSLTPDKRRRLMKGEKLDDIIGKQSYLENSKYYNTSNEAVECIQSDKLFIYQIGDHLMAYELEDINVDEKLKVILLPVVVYNTESQEYEDVVYSVNDEDIFAVVCYQLKKETNTIDDSNWNDEIVTPDVPIKNNESLIHPNHQNIKRIQDNLYSKLLSMYNGSDGLFRSQVYSDYLYDKIALLLHNGSFPFEIVNMLINEFVN